MKTQRLIRAMALAAATLSATAGHAQSNSTALTVSAAVNTVCRLYSGTGTTFLSGAQTMSFTAIDPTVATGTSSGSYAVNYRCNTSTTPTLTVSGAGGTVTNGTTGYSSVLTSGANTIPYKLTWGAMSAASGLGAASAATVSISGTILAADWANKQAGTYTESVTVSVGP